MPEPNSMNTSKGREFQIKAAEILNQYFKVGFQIEFPVLIGLLPKEHKFDLVSDDQQFIGESKNYSWTEGVNVPSAKIGFINEAVFFLQHLPIEKKRFVVIRRESRTKHTETLAEYYYRTNHHLLNGVFIIEIDLETENVREFGGY